MNLTGTSGSSVVHFTLTGSDTASTDTPSSFKGFFLDIDDGYNPFPSGIDSGNGGRFGLTNGSGTFSNVTQGTNVDITGLFFRDSSGFQLNDRFGVDFGTSVGVTDGDVFRWSGAGTVDLSPVGMTFDDLALGTGVARTRYPTALVIDGRLNVATPAVPEPSSLILLALGGFGFAITQRWTVRSETRN